LLYFDGSYYRHGCQLFNTEVYLADENAMHGHLQIQTTVTLHSAFLNERPKCVNVNASIGVARAADVGLSQSRVGADLDPKYD